MKPISENNRLMKQLITLFLVLQCFVVMLPFIPVAEAAEQELMPVIQADDLQVQLQNYFIDHEISEDLVSVGYIYTATGESWYYHPDQWYYSASLYKVPLMMLYAEKEAEGELNQETEFFNMPLSEIEDEVLTFSNNSIAYSMMLTLAQPDACRRMFQRYASLPEEYYSWDFYASSYFSARFMTEVMNTLYSEPDRFPGIAERLMEAQPGHYFRLKLDETGVSVAQKYGNYHDEEGYDWNHTTGIIYTEHPFILTVMTRYGGISETIISDLAQLFYEYTLQAEQRILLLQKEAENEAETEVHRPNDASQADWYSNEPLPSDFLSTSAESYDVKERQGYSADTVGHQMLIIIMSISVLCLIVLNQIMKHRKRN